MAEPYDMRKVSPDLMVPCPMCGAGIGVLCTSAAGKVIRQGHRARTDSWWDHGRPLPQDEPRWMMGGRMKRKPPRGRQDA